jgi:hypothetical protein
MSITFLPKERVLRALTDFHEEPVYSSYLGGYVLMRELSAAERLILQEAATGTAEDGSPTFDTALHRAMLLQLMLVDPTSGRPYADGRQHPTTGEPLIDPRTRTPLFTSDELSTILEGREGACADLINHGLRLSRLLPESFRSGDHAANTAEHDAGSGVSTGGAGSARDADGDADAVGVGTAHDGETLGDDGDAVGNVTADAVE